MSDGTTPAIRATSPVLFKRRMTGTKRLAVVAFAVLIWLAPGSSIAGGILSAVGAAWLWRARRRQRVTLERWQAMTREQQLGEVLPADWPTRTIDDTFPEQLQ